MNNPFDACLTASLEQTACSKDIHLSEDGLVSAADAYVGCEMVDTITMFYCVIY